jgi:hypothetical protein
MKIIDIRKLNNAEVKEEYQVKTSNVQDSEKLT